jgi:hypothetical protein
MAEAKTRPTAVSVAEFLAQVEDPRKRSDSAVLVDMMSRATGEQPRLWGSNIVGFGEYHYKYPSGHEGDAPLVGFSPRKAEFSIYLYGYEDSQVRARLLAKLGRHRMGKGCLYVKRLDQVDVAVLEELVRSSVAALRAAYPAQASSGGR